MFWKETDNYVLEGDNSVLERDNSVLEFNYVSERDNSVLETILFWRQFCFGDNSVLETILFWRQFCFGDNSVLETILFWKDIIMFWKIIMLFKLICLSCRFLKITVIDNCLRSQLNPSCQYRLRLSAHTSPAFLVDAYIRHCTVTKELSHVL